MGPKWTNGTWNVDHRTGPRGVIPAVQAELLAVRLVIAPFHRVIELAAALMWTRSLRVCAKGSRPGLRASILMERLSMASPRARVRTAAVVAIASGLALSACGSLPFSGVGREKNAQATSQAGIGVNAYLWRATLDTLSFMPLLTADPWGGVVNYDWYANPQTPNERFKATVFILDTRLRADALNVTVTKEVRDATGGWVAAPVAAQTETDLENAILTKARQLNLSNAG